MQIPYCREGEVTHHLPAEQTSFINSAGKFVHPDVPYVHNSGDRRSR